MSSIVFPLQRETLLQTTPRFKAELQKLEELPKGFVYMTKRHSHGIILQVTLKEGRFPNLSNLNKGKDIVFDIFMRNDYPFSSPRVYCATEFSVPRLNDRRNFLYCLVRQWGPAIMLYDLIQKLPELLVNIAKHIKDYKFLHQIGEHIQFEPCYEQDFAESCADIFPCTKITKRFLNPKVQTVLILTDSMIILTHPTERKGELKISRLNYLDEVESFDETASDRYAVIFKNQQKKQILQFGQGKSKQVVLSLRNRVSLLQGKPPQPKGSITGMTDEELELKICELLRLVRQKPEKSLLQKLVNTVSDCVELYSQVNEPKFKKYKKLLDEVLKDKTNQKILFE